MSFNLCAQLHQELQKLKNLPAKPTNHSEYQSWLSQVEIKNQALDKLDKVTSRIASFAELQDIINQYSVEIGEDRSILDIIATDPAQVTEETKIYLGDLKWEKGKLPDDLIVLGHLYCSGNNDLTEVKLKYVQGGANFQGCSNLESFACGDIGLYAYFEWCSKINKIKANVRGVEIDFEGQEIATTPAQVTEKTKIYLGDLEWEKGKLPTDLIVLGNLDCRGNNDLTEVKLKYVQGYADFQGCSKIKKIKANVRGLEIDFGGQEIGKMESCLLI